MNLYKRISVTFLFLTLLSLQAVMMAQETVPVKKSDNKVIIEGKIYYIHIVKPGQTLYSISKAYNVTEKDIALENPGVYSGLQIGQMLKIPEEVPTRPRPPEKKRDTVNYIYHVLQAGENIFVLSRQYNIPASAIKEANPGLDYTDLPVGQVILIPRAKSVFRDEDFILHKVRRRDTFYSLSKRYNVSEEEIRKYNPELQWGGLKVGQIIRIPKPSIQAESRFAPADTIPADSMAISPLDSSLWLSVSEYGETLPYYPGKRLKIAFLIPFDYAEPEKDTMNVAAEKANEENE